MATILLSILIFGLAGWVVYKQFTKKGCDGCNCSCGTKENSVKKIGDPDQKS